MIAAGKIALLSAQVAEVNSHPNLGTGGVALNARYGSSTGVDTNDPLLLTHTGTNYIVVLGGLVSVPNNAALNITGSIDIAGRIRMGTGRIVSKGYGGTYTMWLSATHISFNCTTGSNVYGERVHNITSGEDVWVRATRDATTGVMSFFKAPDQPTYPSSWTSLGTVSGATGNMLTNTDALSIGSGDGSAEKFDNRLYEVVIKDGIGGTTVFDVDFTAGITSGDAVTVPYTGTASTALESVRVMSNLGTGGPVLNASLGGNPTQPTTNDPLLLTHTGTNYLYLPGGTGNFAYTPHSTALDITGDIDIRVRVALDNWTPTGTVSPVGKGYGNCFYMYLGSTTIGLGASLSVGPTNIFPSTNWSSRPANGIPIWLRVTRVAATGVVTWFSAADSSTVPSSWTTIGTTTDTAGNMVSNSNMPVGIGAALQNGPTDFENAAGKFYRAQILNGVGGTVVLDANFTTGITSGAQTTFTESSSNAATVTIQRSTSGRKSVAVVRPVWLFGTDDYMEVPDNDLLDFSASQSFTVLAVVRQWATPTNFGRWVDKAGSGGDTGWNLVSAGTSSAVYASIDDGPNALVRNGLSTFTAGAITPIGIVVNRTAQTLSSFAGATLSATASTSSVGSLANTLPLRIGASAIGGSTQDFECLAVAVFRRALTAGEISTINDHYQGTVTGASQTLLSEATFWLDAASSPQPVVSISRSTSGRKTVAVTRPVWVFGTDDSLRVSPNSLLDFGTSQDFTTIAVIRQWATPPNYRSFIQKVQTYTPAQVTVGGTFQVAQGRTVNRVIRVTSTGAVDPAWDLTGRVGTDGTGVLAMAQLANGQVLIAGSFATVRGVTCNNLARIGFDGAVDPFFNTGGTVGTNGLIWAMQVQSDGKILIGGGFTEARGVTVNRIARLNADGSLDTGFNTGGTVGVDGDVRAINVQSDGKIIVAGAFTNARGTLVNRIARLNTDGTLDATFNTGGTVGVSDIVSTSLLQSDGKVVIGGVFLSARGTTVNRLARLNTDGSLDTGFNTGGTVGVNDVIFGSALQSDGKILLGGNFTTARGTTVNSVTRLNTDGTVDTGFNTGGTVGANGTVIAFHIQSDGKIILGGTFSQVRGTAMARLARLNTDGTLDTAFNADGSGVSGAVYAFVTDVVGGARYRGWQLRTAVSPDMHGAIGDGNNTTNFTHFPYLGTATYGALQVVSMVRSGSTITSRLNTTVRGTTTDAGNSLVNPAQTLICDAVDAELVSVAVFRRALTAGEIASIVSYYGGA